MDNMTSKNLVLEELQKAYDKKFGVGDVLDGKLQSMLNYLSVVVAIVPTIAGSTLIDKVGLGFWIIMGLVLILYWVSFRRTLKGLGLSDYPQPISNDWDELEKKCFSSSSEQTLTIIISSYLDALDYAGKQNIKKATAILHVSTLTSWIVFLLIISIPVGLFYPSPTLSCLLHLASCTGIGITP